MITNEKPEGVCKESFVVYFKALFLQLSEEFGGNHESHSYVS
jgi:hypothetical protein